MGTDNFRSEALEIIEATKQAALNARVNKRQCQRLADRYEAVRESLEDNLGPGLVGDEEIVHDRSGNESNPVITPRDNKILTVLNRGKALVLRYQADVATIISSVLNWRSNQEAFKDIHEEIDSLKSELDLETCVSCTTHHRTTSGTTDSFVSFEQILGEEREKVLRSDAEEDKKMMSQELKELSMEGVDMKMVELVVEEKHLRVQGVGTDQGVEDYWQDYLLIDPSKIEIGGAVKELRPQESRSKADKHLEGLALVHRARWLNCDFAVKKFQSRELHWNMEQMRREVGSLVKLRHPHLNQLVGFAKDEHNCYVLMELMDGDLRSLIDKRTKQRTSKGMRPFTASEMVDIIHQIARGMLFLHKQGYVHGELKCSNILVNESDDGNFIDVKIADFRCSRQLGKKSTTKNTMTHRPRWSAPEALFDYTKANIQGEPSDLLLQKGDVYSFGMTCYEIITGNLPFQNVFGSELVEKIRNGVRPDDLPNNVGTELIGIVKKCWDNVPENRPDFETICHFLRRSSLEDTAKTLNLSTKLEARMRVFPIVQRAIKSLWSLQGQAREDPMDKGMKEGCCARTGDNSGGGIPNGWVMHEECSVKHKEKQQKVASLSHESPSKSTLNSFPQYLRIDPIQLRPDRCIGNGGFAQVFQVKWLGCTFAAKQLTATDTHSLQKEFKFLKELLHPHIVRLVGFSHNVQNDRCAIVMEYMDTDLNKLIQSRMAMAAQRGGWSGIVPTRTTSGNEPFTLKEALDILLQIALGMSFLHSHKVMHRDLKPSNVLVRYHKTMRNYNASHHQKFHIKIVDFGVSQYISEPPGKGVGTSVWRAPEILQGLDSASNQEDQPCITQASDVYSFGMVCYEVVTGRRPFEEEMDLVPLHNLYGQIKAGERPNLPKGLNSDLADMIRRCWQQDPKERPCFGDICEELASKIKEQK